MGRVSRLKREINDLLSKEEKIWRQRSCTLWVHAGDGNTRFLHSQATHRFQRNRIEMLENLRGERCEEEEEIANILIEFYDNLFSSSLPD